MIQRAEKNEGKAEVWQTLAVSGMQQVINNMMNKKSHIILWIVTVISYIGILAMYSRLPQRVPIHWDSIWEVDGTADKSAMFLLGGLPLLMNGLFYVLPYIDPRKRNYDPRTYSLMRGAIVLVSIFFTWATVVVAIKPEWNIKVFFPAVLGIMFMVIGNYLPRIKNNFFVGIKNPWALSDDTVWRKTHKAGGYFFLIVGLLMVPMGLIHNRIYNGLVFAFLLIGILAINVYSYLLYAKRK